MAFDASKFSRASNHFNPDIPATFLYTSTDTGATMDTSGYFNEVANQLNVNDIIIAISASGGTPLVSQLLVNAISGAGVVDTNDTVNLAAADAD